MADVIQLKPDELPEAVAGWRADVPGALIYPSLPPASSAAAAAVGAAMQPWQAHFAAHDAERATLASKAVQAAAVTQSALRSADESGAAGITASVVV
ncbi:MAG: hypothetical protein E6R06_22995 [Mycobacterium sp.]|jgi:hypothetical protein|nr:MAG: hypothetical protein E6R06_22995 [Mycobacterium sp.]